MNLPNKLTLLRVLMIPFFVFFFLADFGLEEWLKNGIACFLFVAASITDLLDGKIARKNNLVTNFGKFMDPLADKLLVCSALICFIELGRIPTWAVLIIVWREFIISGFRLVASDDGIVLAAGMSGKIKTVCQMVMVIMLIVHFDFAWFRFLEQVAIYVSVIMTVYSLLDYLLHNKKVFSDGLK